MSKPRSPHDRPLWQFFLALAIVLGSVTAGTLFTLQFQNPRPWNRPTALGHEPPPPVGMVWIPGGEFWMGANDGAPDERPVHRIHTDGFWMDQTEVTNEQFRKFVDATGYVTEAEQKNADRHGLSPGGSLVWIHGAWKFVAGADWQRPEGPSSDVRGREKWPVVNVAWRDAVAFAAWAGKRLPSEAEWEFAARGGLDRQRYVWGKDLAPEGRSMANIGETGAAKAARAASYPPNGYRLFDMSGNVWEWCNDWYDPSYYQRTPPADPPGPNEFDSARANGVAERVIRGGSYLSPKRELGNFRPGARGHLAPDISRCDVGFRCVQDR